MYDGVTETEDLWYGNRLSGIKIEETVNCPYRKQKGQTKYAYDG